MAAYADVGFCQKAVIEFLITEGIAPKAISERLRTVYGDNALSYATVKRWVVHFNSGNKEITDKPRSGRPVSAATAENKAHVDALIRADRRITLQNIMEDIGIAKGTVCDIIKDLAYRKVCARWVPRQLTTELKQSRLDVCTQMLQRYESDGEQFLNSIITGDESWAHHYEPETKRQSMEWRHLGSLHQRSSSVRHQLGK
jgi:transposase